MGNVSSTLSETLITMSHEVSKLFTVLSAAPPAPLAMPNLGDGRSQDELRTTAEIMYNMDTKQCVNIAFLGPRNEYKTAFINACRFISDCRPDTGIISPKNAAIQYIHCDPDYRHVRFWDIGDTEGSFVSKCLYAFDAIVLVTNEVLRPSDVELIKEGCRFTPPCGVLIVRTGMDHFIDKEFGLNTPSTDVLDAKTQQGQLIRESIRNQLLKGGVQCGPQTNAVYLCSSPGMLAARAVNFDGTKYIWDEYDFMKGVLDYIGKRRY